MTYIIWIDYGTEGWVQHAKVTTWDEAIASYLQALRYGSGDVIITELCEVEVTRKATQP